MVEQAQSLTGTAGVQAAGYVDQAAIIVKLPAGLPPGRLRGFETEAAAKLALDTGEIGRFYVIMPDFRQTGAVVVVSGQSAPVAGEAQDFALRLAINTNLTGDERLALAILTPAQVETQALAPEVKTQSTSIMGFVLPFAVMFILFFVITMSGGYMLQSVAKEKENRTAEVLLLSISPRADAGQGAGPGRGGAGSDDRVARRWVSADERRAAGRQPGYRATAAPWFFLAGVCLLFAGLLSVRVAAGGGRRPGPHRA